MNNHIHILGAGSIGLLWGYHLAKSGNLITLIPRQPLTKKCTLEYQRKAFTDSEELLIESAENIKNIDILMTCTKAFDTKEALTSAKHAINASTIIIILQNGMGIHDHIVRLFPQNLIYAAITTEASKKIGPYSIIHTGDGITTFGRLSNISATYPLLELLRCKLSITESPNIERNMWRKLVINCCINPLTVIFNCLNGDLLHNSKALEIASSILTECRSLATLKGFEDHLDDIETDLLNILHASAKNSSSMREDINNNRQTEINYLNGYIIREAAVLNFPTPVNQSVFDQIKHIELTGIR